MGPLFHCWSNNSLFPICCFRLTGKYPRKYPSLPFFSGAKSITYTRVRGCKPTTGMSSSESANVNHKKGRIIKGLMCLMHFTPCPELGSSPEGCIFTFCKVFVLSWACSCCQGRTWALATLPDFLLFCNKTAILEIIEHFVPVQEKLADWRFGGRIRAIK